MKLLLVLRSLIIVFWLIPVKFVLSFYVTGRSLQQAIVFVGIMMELVLIARIRMIIR